MTKRAPFDAAYRVIYGGAADAVMSNGGDATLEECVTATLIAWESGEPSAEEIEAAAKAYDPQLWTDLRTPEYWPAKEQIRKRALQSARAALLAARRVRVAALEEKEP